LNKEDKNNHIFTVKEYQQGKRIDVFLSGRIPGLSRSYLQKLIKNGKVLVNGAIANKSSTLHRDDTITIKNVRLQENISPIQPQNIALDVIYEDDYFFIISKPPGISVHPSPGNHENTLAGAIINYLGNKKINLSDMARPGIVHRLDKDTSGLMIIAKTDGMISRLSLMFKNRQVKKTYTALVYGSFKEEEGKISLPIGRSRIDRKKMSISPDMGRESETNFKIIKIFQNCTLVNAFPLTGRTHQIRVHFSFIGHPVVGDLKYGNKESAAIAASIGLKRQFLHATGLYFIHPVTGTEINLQDNIAEDLESSLTLLKKL